MAGTYQHRMLLQRIQTTKIIVSRQSGPYNRRENSQERCAVITQTTNAIDWRRILYTALQQVVYRPYSLRHGERIRLQLLFLSSLFRR